MNAKKLVDKSFKRRLAALALVVLLILAVFVFRLVDLQLIDGDMYYGQAVRTVTYDFTIAAARGDIVDRNGVPIATSSTGYDVVLNRLFLPDDKLNDTLLDLVGVLETSGEAWADGAPISDYAPYSFTDTNEDGSEGNAALRMKTAMNRQSYATAEQVMEAAVAAYKLEGYTEREQRILVGIRYAMAQAGYSSSVPFTLAEDVGQRTVAVISEGALRFEGVEIHAVPVRVYPEGEAVAHILGTIGLISEAEWERDDYALREAGYAKDETIGIFGIEQSFERQLRGTDGVMRVERATDGSYESQQVVEEPQPGQTVQLTIDLEFQYKLQALLDAYMEELLEKPVSEGGGATGAAVVVLDTSDGGVLGYANWPTYDINDYFSSYTALVNAEGNPLYNRAFMGAYRPGSSFKPVVALTGLLTGEITASSTVQCGGTYRYYTGYSPGCLGVHGNISVRNALQHSCNIFFYDVGRRVGQDAYNEVAEALGLGVKTGVEVAEWEGRLSNPETSEALGMEWSPADVTQAAIGQLNTAVSPVQLATYAASLANSGTRYETHLVKSLNDHNTGEVLEEKGARVVGQLVDEVGAFATVQEGMLMASQQGIYSAYMGSPMGMDVPTKTGSPQEGGSTNGVILAYGPMQEPEIAVAIVVEEGINGYRAAPLMRAIFDEWFGLAGEAE